MSDLDAAATLVDETRRGAGAARTLKPAWPSLAVARAAPPRSVIAAVYRRRLGRTPPSAAMTGGRWRAPSRKIANSPAAAGLAVAPRRLCRTVPCRARRPHGAAAGKSRRARAHFRSAGSAPADDRPRGARRPQRGHLAAAKCAAIRGCLARCAAISVSICRSGASVLSAHDFAQALGAPEVMLTRAAKQRRRADSRLAFRAAPGGGCRRPRWMGSVRSAAKNIWRSRGALDAPAQVKPQPRPEPTPPLEARPRAVVGHRHRELAARSLHDLRQTHAAAASARSGGHTAGRRRPRHRHPRGDRGIHQDVTPRGLPADPVARIDSRSAEKHFAASTRLSGRQKRSGGRAFCASRDWFAGWERERRPRIAKDAWRNSRRDRDSARRTRNFALPARADRIERRADGAFAILDYKTGQPPRRSKCAPGLRRSSLWKRRFCAAAASPRWLPAGLGRANSPMCGSKAASRRRIRSDQVQETARATSMPTARWAKLAGSPPGSASKASRIARWCIRCGGAIRRLRPSRPRQGMVGVGRRERSRDPGSQSERAAPSRTPC